MLWLAGEIIVLLIVAAIIGAAIGWTGKAITGRWRRSRDSAPRGRSNASATSEHHDPEGSDPLDVGSAASPGASPSQLQELQARLEAREAEIDSLRREMDGDARADTQALRAELEELRGWMLEAADQLAARDERITMLEEELVAAGAWDASGPDATFDQEGESGPVEEEEPATVGAAPPIGEELPAGAAPPVEADFGEGDVAAEALVESGSIPEAESAELGHDVAQLAQADRFDSEVRQSEPLESEVRQSEPVESELFDSELVESEVFDSELVESEVFESELVESEVFESELVESEVSESELVESEVFESEVFESEPLEPEVFESEDPVAAGGEEPTVAELEAGVPATVSTEDGAPEAVEDESDRPHDDLKRIRGIGPKLERLLNDLGIVSYRQIAEFTPADIESVGDALGSYSDRIIRDGWVERARAEHRAKYGDDMDGLSSSDGQIMGDRLPGTLAAVAERTGAGEELPVDDLTRIRGIGRALEQRLNDGGIVSYRQIARFSEEDIAVVARALKIVPSRITDFGWVDSAARLAVLDDKVEVE